MHIRLTIGALLHQHSSRLNLLLRVGNVSTQPVIVGVLLAGRRRGHSFGMVLGARGRLSIDCSLASKLEKELFVGLSRDNHFLLVDTEV